MNAANPVLAKALRGPIILITIGTLFLLDRFTPFQFSETWPVILIVLGVLALAGGTRRNPQAWPATPPSGFPQAGQPGAPPPNTPYAGSTAYSGSRYTTSAPPPPPPAGGPPR